MRLNSWYTKPRSSYSVIEARLSCIVNHSNFVNLLFLTFFIPGASHRENMCNRLNRRVGFNVTLLYDWLQFYANWITKFCWHLSLFNWVIRKIIPDKILSTITTRTPVLLRRSPKERSRVYTPMSPTTIGYTTNAVSSSCLILLKKFMKVSFVFIFSLSPFTKSISSRLANYFFTNDKIGVINSNSPVS